MSTTPEILTKGNILVVDDTPDNLRLLMAILTRRGYKVRPAPSGQLALKAVKLSSPDLILLDIMMPEMDGYEVCQQLKRDPATQDIPVIFLSALDEVADKVKAFEVGGVDYITKPFDPDEVLIRVKTHITLQTIQQELATKNEALEETSKELEAKVDELATLNLIIQTVTATTDLTTTLQIITTTMCRLFKVHRVNISLFNQNKTEFTIITENLGRNNPLDLIGVNLPLVKIPDVQQVVEYGESLIIANAETHPATDIVREVVTKYNVKSIMVIPLISRAKVMGSINLISINPNRQFTEEDMRLAEMVASQVAGAIQNAWLLEEQHKINQALSHANQRMQTELALAREVQESLLPPSRPAWDKFDIICYTTTAYEIGGDFYDYHVFNPKRYALAIGDVSGKGASAALLMATCLTRLDTSLALELTPAERLIYLDKAIAPHAKPHRQNCAICYIELEVIEEHDEEYTQIHMVNAGCIPPYIKHQTGEIETYDLGGFALGQGLGAVMGYSQQTATLTTGDLVILTSDGVVEAKNPDNELFGFSRLETALTTGPISTAEALLNHLQDKLKTFVAQEELHDDLTIVVIRVS